MSFWLVVGVCAALFVLVVAVAGSLNLFNQPMSDESSSQAVAVLPEDFTDADVEQLRFTTELRGYRPDEVDQVLDRLRERIAELESERPGASVPPQTGE